VRVVEKNVGFIVLVLFGLDFMMMEFEIFEVEQEVVVVKSGYLV
jgi:hypothetical protein